MFLYFHLPSFTTWESFWTASTEISRWPLRLNRFWIAEVRVFLWGRKIQKNEKHDEKSVREREEERLEQKDKNFLLSAVFVALTAFLSLHSSR